MKLSNFLIIFRKVAMRSVILPVTFKPCWLRGIIFGLIMPVSLLVLSPQAYTMNLTEMQHMALNNRKLIKKYIVNLEKSDADIIRARGGYFPAVDISYRANSLDEASVTEHEQNSVVYGAVSWNLFSGFRDRYNIESAQLLRTVATYRLKSIRQDLQLQVALRYLDVFESKARLKVAEDAYNTLEKIYLDSKNRLAVGLIGKNELLKFKVDFDNADITLKKAKADLKKRVHLLSREIDAEVELVDLKFGEFLTPPEPGDLKDFEAIMLQKSSELEALRALIAAAAVQVNSGYSAYYPQVNVVGSYSNYDDALVNGSGEVNRDEFRAQLVMSMNLFNGFAREAAIGKAKLEVSGLQYDLLELEDTFKTDLENLFIDYQVSFANITVAKENILHAQENLRITQLKYNEGLQRESDLLDAITSLSRAQYNHMAVVRTVFLNHFRVIRMVEEFSGE